MEGASCTNIDQIESVLGGLSETYSRGVFAISRWTLDIISSVQSWVLYDVLVNLEHHSFITSSIVVLVVVISLVDTVVPLVTFSGLLEMSTDSAIVDESLDVLVLIVHLLLRVEHVVTLLAEPHTLELTCRWY